jgi:hypothetical protein
VIIPAWLGDLEGGEAQSEPNLVTMDAVRLLQGCELGQVMRFRSSRSIKRGLCLLSVMPRDVTVTSRVLVLGVLVPGILCRGASDTCLLIILIAD